MTHFFKIWIAVGLLVGIQGSARADQAAFERAYQVQQEGYSKYFKGVMTGKGATSASDQKLRHQFLDPAREAGKKAFKEAAIKAGNEGHVAIKGSRALFDRIRQAEKSGKKPGEKPEDKSREPAAKAARQFEKAPREEPKKVDAIDGKNLDDVIDF